MTKAVVTDLALFGGEPEFAEPIVFGSPNIGRRDVLFDRLNAVLDSRWLSNGGRMSREFERRVAEIAGTRYCVATCNATSALQLALRAGNVTGEVIVPSFTFAATVHAVAWMGLRPVLCDVDSITGSMDASHVEALIGPQTGAILGVHLWGLPCHPQRLERLARRYRIPLVFDAAHAFGCSWRGRSIGGFGDAEVFSFHATKFINSFEGGALVTDNADIAASAAQMRNFGIAGQDTVESVGLNAKMSEAAAAMGLTSLDHMDEFVAVNRANYCAYRARLAGVSGLRVLDIDEQQRSNYQYVVAVLHQGRAGLSRDRLLEILAAENVAARRYFYPGCHRMAPYRTTRSFPGTDRLAQEAFVLPTGTRVDQHQVARICELIRFAVEHADTIGESTSAVEPAHRERELLPAAEGR